ncbi:MAG TPA: ATP-binding protein [Candidatus Nitrosocosmicus sp.]|nr:ATP-binding protein [Candidatus Nitrosocosmicus sp.]
MHGPPLFILTAMELTAFLILWSAFSIKFNCLSVIKLAITAIVISLITVITDYFRVEYSGITNYITAFLILQFLFRKPVKQSITYYMVSIALCFCTQIAIVYTLKSLGSISYDVHDFSSAIKINILFILANLLLAFTLPIDKMQQYLGEEFSMTSFFLINTALYAIILKTAWDFNKVFLWGRFLSLVLVSVLLILSNLIFLRHSVKIGEQKKIIETYNKYSPIIKNLIEEARRKQHDFKNHLNTIYGITQVAADNELRVSITQYIRSLNYELKDLDLLIQINNKVLSGIIYCKACLAKERGIDFEFDIKSDLSDTSLEDYKLSEVLNNLLDNAFESAYVSDHKKVTLMIEENENHHIIEVKNFGESIKPEYISKIFDNGFTTKSSKDHGYGLYNVKKTVESVKGQIQLLYDDEGYIVLRILF